MFLTELEKKSEVRKGQRVRATSHHPWSRTQRHGVEREVEKTRKIRWLRWQRERVGGERKREKRREWTREETEKQRDRKMAGTSVEAFFLWEGLSDALPCCNMSTEFNHLATDATVRDFCQRKHLIYTSGRETLLQYHCSKRSNQR